MAEHRKYELKRRAERQAATRLRIVDAVVALHQEVGPARTSISAIAERAGVERLTVYRHFPDGPALLRACQQHYRAAHPAPDPAPWAAIADPAERLQTALSALYAFYRETEPMRTNLLRDAPAMPALAAILQDLPRYAQTVREVLARGLDAPADGQVSLRAVLGLAVDFQTWRTLTRTLGLDDDAAVRLTARLVRCVAHPPSGC